jgi:hypothetical protein
MVCRYLGLRVDVCTLEGLRHGVPNLLRLFRLLKINVTFFIAMGPDYSGRAIFNVFRRKGFFKKMVRTNAVTMYGLRTMLYGTLLPAPIISERGISIIKDIQKDGHEIGIHGWNHRRWQDNLDSFTKEEIRAEYECAINRFKEIIGYLPICSAAPGWVTSPESLCACERYSFSFASDSRGHSPFYPKVDGRSLKTLQIPVTLPTLDEVLGRNGITIDRYNEYIIRKVERESLPVYVVHAEAEGRRYLPWFEDLLKQLRSLNIEIGTLSRIKTMVSPITSKINIGSVPGRSGLVTLQSI